MEHDKEDRFSGEPAWSVGEEVELDRAADLFAGCRRSRAHWEVRHVPVASPPVTITPRWTLGDEERVEEDMLCRILSESELIE